MIKREHADPTVYHTDLDGEVFDSLKAEADSVRSFQLAISRLRDDIRRARILIHKAGPLGSDAAELEALAQVYLRGMREVAQIVEHVQTAPNGVASH